MGVGNRDRDRDRGRDRESGAVGGQQAAIWLISVKMNVYKKGAVKKWSSFFHSPFFIYPISW